MSLEKLAENQGIEYTDKGNGHIQLKGALLVNYYPYSKNRSAYVSGTTKAVKRCTDEQAIEMCFIAPEFQGVKDSRSGNSRAKRKKMLKKIKHCHWCKTSITLDTSTIEHVIPLGLGGLDNANNRTLACLKCNTGRGCGMPELEDNQTENKRLIMTEYTSELAGSGQFGICAKCKKGPTKEGHDGCLGTLIGPIMNACCGHGNNDQA